MAEEVFRLRRNRIDPKTGKTVSVESGKYHGWIRLGPGRRKRKALHEDKATARDMLRELSKRAALASVGIHDPYDTHRHTELSDHLDDFEASLRAKGRSEDHVKLVTARARAVIEGAGFDRISDIDALKVELMIAKIAKAEGLSVQTTNFYLAAAKQFCRWLVKNERTGRNPLAHLEGRDADAYRTKDHRPYTLVELSLIVSAAQNGPPVLDIAGPDRAMLYNVAAYTGLRAKELASLTPESFRLDTDPPTVTVRGADTKTKQGRQKTLPVHPGLAALLLPWMSGKPAGARLWPGAWAAKRHAAQLVQADLQAVTDAMRKDDPKAKGLPYKAEDGRFRDFHGLRKTLATALYEAGVHPKDAQGLMRHSTIGLTMDTYTDTALPMLAAAMGKLPPPPAPVSDPEKRAPMRAPSNPIPDHSSQSAEDAAGRDDAVNKRRGKRRKP